MYPQWLQRYCILGEGRIGRLRFIQTTCSTFDLKLSILFTFLTKPRLQYLHSNHCFELTLCQLLMNIAKKLHRIHMCTSWGKNESTNFFDNYMTCKYYKTLLYVCPCTWRPELYHILAIHVLHRLERGELKS